MASAPSSLPLGVLEALPRVPPIDNTFGAVFLGTFLGLTLYGINLHQTYRYIRLFPKDLLSLQLWVFFTFALETMHTVMGIHISYHYLVECYFDPLSLLTGVWSIKLISLNMGAVMFVSQSFFARRVWLLGRHQRYLAVLTGFLLIGEMAFATAATAETYIQVTFERFSHIAWIISIAYSMAVVADGTVAVSLVLAVRRSRKHHNKEDTLLDVILLYTINTGALSSLMSIMSLIFVSLYRDNLIYVGFNTVATRLYANSLLAVSPVDRGIEGYETGSLGLALRQTATIPQTTEAQWNIPPPPPPRPTVLDIKVTTDVVRAADFDAEESETGSQKQVDKQTLV
ncbi:hypothetical protein C8Q77DRAFT_1155946 [Trametes polyzona]|nr:hypothetical protein C8Q77DRAFT_1155946 [Trametes polyzona]